MDAKALWAQLLLCLEQDVDPDELEVWFKDTEAKSFDGERLIIEAGNRYYVAWIVDNYVPLLSACAQRTLERTIQIKFVVDEDPTTDLGHSVTTHATPRPRASGLNPNQTFDTFVVGECNKFAHAAALGVTDNPGDAYNPLYIYGPTGLGKTHLMHAIGHTLLSKFPEARVMYVTAEDFTNEMINAIRFKRTDAFRAKYREGATLLLVDDIQFLSGKERTQEEFFFTFNSIQGSGGQIVLTSDVEPKDIKGLAPRLRTRFEGGLVADMQPPDVETLMAILHKKAEASGFHLPVDLAAAIANVAQGNVRELEGIINRLGALVRVFQEPLTLEFAQRHLPSLFTPDRPDVTVSGIIEAVARFFNLKSADIIGKRRTRALTAPRHLAMYLAREHTPLSYPDLGAEFGDRDHTTVQHGVKKVAAAVTSDHELAYQVRLIEQSLGIRGR